MGKHRKPDIPDGARPYEQGYRKPPPANRFKPGNSANPHGRPPKRSETVGELIKASLAEIVEVPMGGKIVRMSRLKLIVTATTQNAIKDRRSFELLLRLLENHRDDTAQTLDPNLLSESDQAMLDRFTSDLAKGHKFPFDNGIFLERRVLK